MSYEIPSTYDHLKVIANKFKTVDAPDIFVRIRNSIVHSQETKRKELANIPDEVKNEALQLSIWYIELSLLYILKFEGKYSDRSTVSSALPVPDENYVPWKK